MAVERVTFFGAAGAIEPHHIGGVGSVLRRLAAVLSDAGASVRFLAVGGSPEAGEEARWPFDRVDTVTEGAQRLAEIGGHAVFVHLPPLERLRFASLRASLQPELRVHDLRLVLSETGMKRRLGFVDHDLHEFNGTCFCVSPRLVRFAAHHAPRVGLLWPPVPESLFSLVPSPGPVGSLRVGYVGRLDEWKGADLLPEIAERLASLGIGQIRVHGYEWRHAPVTTAVRKRVEACDRIELHLADMASGGQASDDELARILGTLDVIVLPYRSARASIDTPALVLEAMAAGVAPVTSDVADLRDLVGRSGAVLPVAAPPIAYADAIVDLFKVSFQARRDLARARAHELGVASSVTGDWFLRALEGDAKISAPTTVAMDLVVGRSHLESQNAPTDLAAAEASHVPEWLRLLAREADAAGLAWAVLRNHEGLPEKMGRDIDLLVELGALKAWSELVNGLACRLGLRVLRRAQRLGFYSSAIELTDETILNLDCFDSLYYRSAVYHEATPLLRERRAARFGCTLRPGHEAASILLHDLLGLGEVRERYCERIGSLSRGDPAGWRAFLEHSLGAREAARVGDLVEAGRWDDLAGAAAQFQRAATLQAWRRDPAGCARGLATYLVHRAEGVIHPEGVIIILVGPDGGGKSTIAHLLAADLEKSFVHVHQRHGRPGRFPPMRDLLARASKRAAARFVPPERRVTDVDEKPTHPIRAYANLVYCAAEHLLEWPSLALNRAHGHVFLYDRYFHEYFVAAEYAGVPRAVKRLFAALVPKPDLVLLVSCAPDVAAARKGELTPAEAARQVEEWRRLLCTLLPGAEIHNDGSLDEAVRQARSLVRAMLSARQEREPGR